MSPDHLDDLARDVAQTPATSRRRILAGLFAAMSGTAAVSALDATPAFADNKTQCPPGLTPCNRLCRDVNSDAANCGACGTTCTTSQVCRAGTCVAIPCTCTTCSSGQTLCNGVCVNTKTDTANCGACGNACPSGSTCTNGTCTTTTCPSGQTLCNGVCVDTSTNTANCGSCGHTCPNFPNAIVTCVNGGCNVTCRPPFFDCDGIASNGCETNTSNDPANCGACGRTCATGQSCVSGQCV